MMTSRVVVLTWQITSATNTQYFIQTSDVGETQSWCYHLKHNLAVLVCISPLFTLVISQLTWHCDCVTS